MSIPTQFENVTALTKANVYFDGKVVSHVLMTQAGDKITLGAIQPGTYTFDTGAPERMDVVEGVWRVKLPGKDDYAEFGPGQSFDVPGNSEFEVRIDEGVAQYICSYL